ncbi:11989_t:CDS:2, partial [Dentiscutata heterogama]
FGSIFDWEKISYQVVYLSRVARQRVNGNMSAISTGMSSGSLDSSNLLANWFC